ncbi:MAG: aminoglycoside 6'-N-acetyltransferase [Runella zeae]
MKSVIVESLSENNTQHLAQLFLELWPECDFEEEWESCQEIVHSDTEIAFLLKSGEIYVAFIHVSLRTDYVEGATYSPTAYVEGIFVKEDFRRLGLSKKLLQLAEEWAIQKGCVQLASDTEISNIASIDFHKKVGFEEVNRIVCFVKDLS